jgi:uncharacterized protein (TIGR02996 family)
MIDWGEPFLAAIRAEPDEDAPRLVYCDWLEEQGDPVRAARAEFIRWQLAAPVEIIPFGAPCGYTLAVPRETEFAQMPMIDRQVELYRRYVRAWNGPIHYRLHQGPLKKLVDSRRGWIRRWSYRRGFVSTVWAQIDAVETNADELFTIGPVERLNLLSRNELSSTVETVLTRLTRYRLRTVDIAGVNVIPGQHNRLSRIKARQYPWTLVTADHQSAGR